MAFRSAMQGAAGPGPMGVPPAPTKPQLGAAPAQPHIQPAPYDSAMDPAWKAVIPNLDGDHELRNFLNQIAPEERQMLLKRVGSMTAGLGRASAPGAVPPGIPPDSQPGMFPPAPPIGV